MGSCLAKPSKKNASSAPQEQASSTAVNKKETQTTTTTRRQDKILEMTLKKTEPRCNGMFWREDPRGKVRLEGGYNWPRDGAKLRGTEFVDDFGDQWLLTTHVFQQDEQQWTEAPPGACMPFEEDHCYLEE